jgi:hypothetical protein
MSEPQIIATFNDCRGLVAALRECRVRRDISFATLDEITQQADGYWSKTLSITGNRRVTMESLSLGLGALGIKCVVIDDPEQYAKVQRHMTKIGAVKRETKAVRMLAVNSGCGKHTVTSVKMLRKIAASGGHARNRKLGPRRRKQIARQAALVRWASGSLPAETESAA